MLHEPTSTHCNQEWIALTPDSNKPDIHESQIKELCVVDCNSFNSQSLLSEVEARVKNGECGYWENCPTRGKAWGKGICIKNLKRKYYSDAEALCIM